MQIKLTIPISVLVYHCHLIFLLLFTYLLLFMYLLTFLSLTENRNMGGKKGRAIPRSISLQEKGNFLKLISRFHFLVDLFFPPDGVCILLRAGPFTHFLIVPLSALLDYRNSFMKSNSNPDSSAQVNSLFSLRTITVIPGVHHQ